VLNDEIICTIRQADHYEPWQQCSSIILPYL
jgi:hypothetical protein